MISVRVHCPVKYEAVLMAMADAVGATVPPADGAHHRDGNLKCPFDVPSANLEEFKRLVSVIATATEGM